MTDEEFQRIKRDYRLGRALYAHIPLLVAEVERLRYLLKSADELIEDLGRGVEVLDAIPGCPIHGQVCAPWALEWIAKMRYATIPMPFECPCVKEVSRENVHQRP